MKRTNRPAWRLWMLAGYGMLIASMVACVALGGGVVLQEGSLRLNDGIVQGKDDNGDWVPVAGKATFELVGKLESTDPWKVSGRPLVTNETTQIDDGLQVNDVVRVFAAVREKTPARLVMVGDGPDRAEAERLCRELEICSDVRFLGKQTALQEILSASDLFLMPSQNESFGLSALEAMACGVPVLSTSVGGLPELNVHGQTGYISEIGDVDRMARYGIDLLRDRKRYERFSRAARERAEAQFSADLIVPQYEEYYRQILELEPIVTGK